MFLNVTIELHLKDGMGGGVVVLPKLGTPANSFHKDGMSALSFCVVHFCLLSCWICLVHSFSRYSLLAVHVI